ncbi:MAG TPA: cytochrome c [Vicinamibacteria bacterium]
MKALALGLALLVPVAAADAPPRQAAAPAASEKGKAVFQQACATCHMMDDSGVPNMQPSLDGGNKTVQGNPDVLIALVLKGAEGVLPAKRERYVNQMPAFDTLADDEIAAVLTYVRSSFGNKAPAVTVKQVAAVRAKR